MSNFTRPYLLRYALLLPLLATMGCSRITAEQRSWLNEARTAYDAQQYNRSIEYASRFLEQVMDGPEATQALYYKGLSEAYTDQREQAYADLRHVVTMEGSPTMKWRAHAALGSMHFEREEWADAARHYQEAAAIMPKSQPKDLVLYRSALAAERAGDWSSAQAAYAQLVDEFPGSESAKTAERRLHAGVAGYAVKCGEFAVPENADNMMFDLQRQGLQPHLFQDKRGTTTVYVVLLGRYSSREEAEHAAAQLRQTFPMAEVWP